MTNKFAFISEKATAKFKKTVKQQNNSEINPKRQKPRNSLVFRHPAQSPQKSLFVKSTNFSFQKKKKKVPTSEATRPYIYCKEKRS